MLTTEITEEDMLLLEEIYPEATMLMDVLAAYPTMDIDNSPEKQEHRLRIMTAYDNLNEDIKFKLLITMLTLRDILKNCPEDI